MVDLRHVLTLKNSSQLKLLLLVELLWSAEQYTSWGIFLWAALYDWISTSQEFSGKSSNSWGSSLPSKSDCQVVVMWCLSFNVVDVVCHHWVKLRQKLNLVQKLSIWRRVESFCLSSQCHISHCQRLYNSNQSCQDCSPPTLLCAKDGLLVCLWLYLVLIELPILSMTPTFSGVPNYFHGCSKHHLHFSNQTVLHLLNEFVLQRKVDNKNKSLFFFHEYVTQLLLIISPSTKVLLKYWWWKLLPSSLLGNMVSGVTWYIPGPLRTNSVLILSVRCEGQSAGSVW